MPGQLLIAAFGTALIAVLWVAVQQAWRRSFPDACADPDPLADRVGCHGCTSETTCPRRAASRCAAPGRENP